jgi:transcriptional regulator with XRE-family HTH domain
MTTKKRTKSYRRSRQTLGSNLKWYRTAKKLTQLELAESAGLDRSYIGHIELNNRMPTVSTLKKLGTVLGVHWTVLVVGYP